MELPNNRLDMAISPEVRLLAAPCAVAVAVLTLVGKCSDALTACCAPPLSPSPTGTWLNNSTLLAR